MMNQKRAACGHAFNTFVGELESIVAAERAQERIVARVEVLVNQLISTDLSWLKEEHRRVPEGKSGIASGYGQYCLYRRANALSVVVFCWGAGQGTPVHDHLTWGVLGFIDGCEKETRYRRVDDGIDRTHAQLTETDVVLTTAGQTSHIMTPTRDVHKVENPGSRSSVSLHVYGCDMGSQRRRKYDLDSGIIEWYVTPHDSVSFNPCCS
ncbi:MAG: cysteine dioxygenase [Candidatus Velthaea sp.]